MFLITNQGREFISLQPLEAAAAILPHVVNSGDNGDVLRTSDDGRIYFDADFLIELYASNGRDKDAENMRKFREAARRALRDNPELN